jgi:hypothetical protein
VQCLAAINALEKSLTRPNAVAFIADIDKYVVAAVECAEGDTTTNS